MTDPLPAFLLPIIAQLRRRRLPVGIADLHALRLALRAGFGLGARDELRELCVSLWAKSPAEAEIVRATFANLAADRLLADWTTTKPTNAESASADPPTAQESTGMNEEGDPPPTDASEQGDEATAETGTVSLSYHDLNLDLGRLRTKTADRGLVLVPQYPLTSREVAQAWRYLRRPVRYGPPIELDISATIHERARRAVATPPVLIPRRRNAVRLLMMIDRQGSMSPYHGYVDYVVRAIQDAGRIDDIQTVYFHDLPETLPGKRVLDEMRDMLRPDLDDVLSLIAPLRIGSVYEDPSLIATQPLEEILAGLGAHTAVLVISDAGAARRQFDIVRLLDTIALIKALGTGGARIAWLNPVPRERWARTTAGQIARHVPMFPFTQSGLYQAVDALRGRPVLVEQPV